MIKVPLTIRYAEKPQRAPVAWLVGGAEVQVWLAEWAAWDLPMKDWRIVPIADLGVLTILPARQMPPQPTTAMAIGRIGERVYLPTHADLSCAVTAEELESLLLEEVALALLYPGTGIIAATAGQILSVGDLLRASAPLKSDWSCALPGETLGNRLHAVFPQRVPSLEDILGSGRGDIGSRQNDWRDLPPRPNEPGDRIWDQAQRGMGQAAAGMANWLARMFSGGASPEKRPAGMRPGASGAAAGGGLVGGWLKSLSNWANQTSSGVSRQLEELRNKEVLRLLNMLKTNPDEGLKYALPISCGGAAHRGGGPPGGHLLPRNVDFSLAGIGGGGVVDFWDLPWKYQEELRRQYRELANRELQVGRYRRAAYIFAELLGELDSAASALQSGAHWREAAVLYSERLNRPRSAAECLERGGLLSEAITIYAGLGDDEKVGDLYARLEQSADAETAWRKAMEGAIVQRQDYVDAARIAEQKLASDEETLEILDRGWHAASQQSRSCLTRYFEVLGARGRHDEARKRLLQFRRPNADCTHDLRVVDVLSEIVGSYPDVDFCERASDIVRVLAGAHLRAALDGERQRFVQALKQLVPGDALLARDGNRFLSPPKPPRVRPTPSRYGLPQPRRIRQFRLPAGCNWKAVVSQGECFYAAGIAWGSNRYDCTLQLERGRWTGEMQVAWDAGNGGHIADNASVQLAADPGDRGPLLVAVSGGDVEGSWKFAASESFSSASHAFCARYDGIARGVCYAHGLAYRLTGSDPCCAFGYSFSSFQKLGALARTFVVGDILDDFEEGFFPSYGRPDLLAVGLHRNLHLFTDKDRTDVFELPEPILHLAGSAPFSRLRIAAGLAHGGSFLWAAAGNRIEDPPRRFAEDLIAPSICFTATGLLVAVSENGGEIFSTTEGKLVLKSRLPPLGQRPVAVLPTDYGNQFAIFMPEGSVEIMEL